MRVGRVTCQARTFVLTPSCDMNVNVRVRPRRASAGLGEPWPEQQLITRRDRRSGRKKDTDLKLGGKKGEECRQTDHYTRGGRRRGKMGREGEAKGREGFTPGLVPYFLSLQAAREKANTILGRV